MTQWRAVPAILLLVVLLCAATALAQDENTGPEDQTAAASRRLSLLRLIYYSGPIGFIIIFLSFVAVALVIGNARGIRRETLMPTDTVVSLQELIAGGKLKEALVRCEQDDSYVSRVVGAGLSVVGSGSTDAAEIQTAMEEAGDEQTSRLYRKIEYLSLIGNVAPMLGLLGTVTGMIIAFNQIAIKAERVRPPDLAHGISQALVTTCMGLIVAIPIMTAFVLFRNRIDALVGEAEVVVAQVTARLKKLGAPSPRPDERT